MTTPRGWLEDNDQADGTMTTKPDTYIMMLPVDEAGDEWPFKDILAKAEKELRRGMSLVGYTDRPYYLDRYERQTQQGRPGYIKHWFCWKVKP